MPGIYLKSCLNLAFALLFFSSFSQGTKEEYLEYARQQHAKGDYISAIQYYEKAYELDSQSVDLLWDYAEAERMYKDYRKAEHLYERVYEKEGASLHIRSLFYLGEMQKSNGKYEAAIETFKTARKKYVDDKKYYLYLKSKQELESCLWAKKALRDTAEIAFIGLPENTNSVNSEFAHTFYGNTLFFSSMRGDSSNVKDEIYSLEYKNDLYRFNPAEEEEAIKLTELHDPARHIGNGSFSLDKKRFYYSSCKEKGEQLSCKIMLAYYVNGNMESIDTLGEIINEEDANTTMPFVAKFDNSEVLFFASDRWGSQGGLDLYYSYIKDGNQYSRPIAIEQLNTPDNELSPFFDSINQKLYFSSSWHYGFGGYDIFSSSFENYKFQKPVNMELPVNSSANDMYFFIHNDTSYFSSNRIGVLHTQNPTCCTDIFSYVLPSPVPLTDSNSLVVKAESIQMTLEELNKKLPVTLYFHNDIPNPKSLDTTTSLNYISSYNDYIAMIPQYKREYSKGLKEEKAIDAQEDIESFFTEYVEQGLKDLELFRNLLLVELQKGNSIILTVKGFASPLAKSDYNVRLTKRRIASLVNYLSEYEDGVFRPYLNGTGPKGTKLQIQEVPFGEYTANKLISDNPNDLKNSIYSRSASLERKIEIQSVSFLKHDSANYLIAKEQVIDLGKIDPGKNYTCTFEIKNTGKEPIEIEKIEIPCSCNTAQASAMKFETDQSGTVKVSFDPKGYSGKVVKSVYVHVKNSNEPLRLVLTGELK